MNGKFSISYDEETYQDQFDTREEACKEAAASCEVGTEFWVGECVTPTQPEQCFDVIDWLKRVSCCDEYSMECAEDWDESTKEQREELEGQVREVMAKWLDRHDLRPKFWCITDAMKYVSTESGYEESKP